MEEYTFKLQDIFEQLTELQTFMAKATSTNYHESEAKYVRLERLESKWDSIKGEVFKFNAKQKDDSTKVQLNNFAFGSIIDSIRGHMFELRAEHSNTPQANQPQVNQCNTTVKLPQLQVPIFSGQIEDWPKFFGLYNSVIHKNVTLCKLEKMQYLISLVKGSALKLIENLHLSENNYEIAYNLLLSKYQNQRILANMYLKQLFEFKGIVSDSATQLQSFLSVYDTNYEAIKALQLKNTADYMLFYRAISNLDSNTRQLFEAQLGSSDTLPTFKQLMAFVQTRLKIKTLCSDVKPSNSSVKPKVMSQSLLTTNENIVICSFCNGSHKSQECSLLLSTPVEERQAFVQSKKRCIACFGNHVVKNCMSKYKCYHCKSKWHHTLLHRIKPVDESSPNVGQASKSDSTDVIPVQASMSCVARVKPNRVLLGTALARITTSFGLRTVRIVVDPGSQLSFISRACAELFGFQVYEVRIGVSGVGNVNNLKCLTAASCQLTSVYDSNLVITVETKIIDRVVVDLPGFSIDSNFLSRFVDFQLADPMCFKSSPVDILLGADVYNQLLLEKPPVLGTPVGIHTIFGLVLTGPVSCEVNNPHSQVSLLTTLDLNESIERFWQQEEVSPKLLSDPLDSKAEDYFLNTTSRTVEGRYMVRLPFSDNVDDLGSNRLSSIKRLNYLSSKLERQPELKQQYTEFIEDYISSGHMSIAPSQSNYVIPHHAVFKTSTTTKLRVVYDASAKDEHGLSLNDVSLKGPKLQADIRSILLKFRLFPIALTGDIKQMYRQILVHPMDRKYQHILWRSSPAHPMEEYELNTVTYGLRSSPYLAQRVLKALTKDEGDKFPQASQLLLNNTYMDDIVGGAMSEEEVSIVYNQLKELLAKGGFFPRKWSTTSTSLLESIPLEDREQPLLFQEDGNQAIKLLGLGWNSQGDSFSYTIQQELPQTSAIVNKRLVLSLIARIYDPLGWIGPVIFWAKCFMQLTWQHGFNWDDDLPPPLAKLWSEFCQEISLLADLCIPRYVPALTRDTILVGFCDASFKGYGAVFYLVCYQGIDISTHLMISKTRVASLKPITIPRLELNAAKLLTDLLLSLELFLQNSAISQVRLMSDSTTVLSWLKKPPPSLKAYTANRIGHILENTSIEMWSHVSGKENPADPISRGLLPSELKNASLWWDGPSFLKDTAFLSQQSLSEWPSPAIEDYESEILKSCLLVEAVEKPDFFYDLVERCSTFSKLLHAMVYVLRFIKSVRLPLGDRCFGPASVQELRQARLQCVKIVQGFHYHREIQLLSNSKSCSPSFHGLTPFIDALGLLRVGGRLRFSPLTYDRKHPLLLPANDPFVKLLVQDYHLLTLHGGPKITLALLQHQYWIVGARNLVRKCYHECVVCVRHRAPRQDPKMGDLPVSRFAQGFSFLNVGVDYAGPYEIKDCKLRKPRKFKAYIALFVCMSSKATHLELVSDLSTAAFLAAFDRFVGRRGLCNKVFSDCGTNFVGASSEFKQLMDANNEFIFDRLAGKGVEWVFNPPNAPEFGGLWEAAVKSCKFHLKRVIGTIVLTFEEMSTILVRVESVLNSRPLMALSFEPNDDQVYLSPAHLLIGRPLVAAPAPDLTSSKISILDRWNLVRQMFQCFWQIWRTEYLVTLIKRTKNVEHKSNISLHDVVILKKENSPPLTWPLGRVVQLYPGKDGISRVADVKVGESVFTRPVNRLIKLPISA